MSEANSEKSGPDKPEDQPGAPNLGAPVAVNMPVTGVPLPYGPNLFPNGLQPILMIQPPQQAIQQVWQGPLPPPAALREYEEILPGAFDRILKLAENAQSNQHTQTMQAMAFTQMDMKRGHWMGFSFAVGCGIGAIALAATTAAIAVPIGLLSVPVMAVAQTFFTKRKGPEQSTPSKAPEGPAAEPPRA